MTFRTESTICGVARFERSSPWTDPRLPPFIGRHAVLQEQLHRHVRLSVNIAYVGISSLSCGNQGVPHCYPLIGKVYDK